MKHAVFAVPGQPTQAERQRAEAEPVVAELVPFATPAALAAILLRRRGPLVLLGARDNVRLPVLWALAARGRFSFLCRIDGGWARVRLATAWFWLVSDALHRGLTALPPDHGVTRAVLAIRRVAPLRSLWRAALRGGGRADWQPAAEELAAIGAALADNPRPSAPRLRPTAVLAIATLGAGGAERQFLNTARGLKRRGYGVQVVVTGGLTHGGDFYRAALDADGIPVTPAAPAEGPPWRGWSERQSAALLAMPRAFAARVVSLAHAAKGADVLHAWQDGPAAVAAFAAPLAGARRLVVSFRNVAPVHYLADHELHWRAAFIMLAGRDDAVLTANSAAGRSSYAAWLGIDEHRITLLRNGIDLSTLGRPGADAPAEVRRRIGAGDAEPVIGGFFRLAPEKRPLAWIDAAGILAARRSDVRFILVGDGPLRRAVAQRARVHGLGGRLTLLQPRHDIAAHLLACDVVMHAGESEGTPNVLIEAQALGIPVAAMPGGGIAEAMADAPCARLAATDQPAHLAEAVLALLAGQTRGRAGEGAAWAESRFNLESMVSETVRIYGWDHG